MFDPTKPYDNLPLLPPAADVETKAILKKCIEARAALAQLNSTGKLVPNQKVLINIIPLLEAKDSSEIENIVTTTDELFKHSLPDTQEKPNAATKEALQYRAALRLGFKSIAQRPLSAATAEEVCSVIKNTAMGVRKVPGTALANDRTGQVIYTPPSSEAIIREKLADHDRFLHEATDIDPLIRLAVGHYQFEAIHPFTDGNGRTGRIVNLLFLVSEGLLDQPILYLSRYILAHRSEYYHRLLSVTTAGEWEEWILYMLEGIRTTAEWTFAKLMAIRALFDNCAEFLREKEQSVYSHELVDVLFTQPYCRIANFVDAGIAKRETASRYLKKLVAIGVLEEHQAGRDKLFLNRRFLDLLGNDDHSFRPYGA